MPGRIDGRLRDIIVQVEVCTLQDENIKLCVGKIDCEEIKSVDQETMGIKRKIMRGHPYQMLVPNPK